MNPFKSLSRLFGRTETKIISLEDLGWHNLNMGGTRSYKYYRENNFENAYSSITAIANRSMVVEPYAIDQNGKKLKQNSIIDALYHPNQEMSAVDFREALSIMTLVHNKTYILVHTKSEGEKITANNISGFTFLEGVVESWDYSDNTVTYKVGSDTYDQDQVIVLKGINPYDLEKGYAPAVAARRWTRLDDYIADYQSGFFENGAVPAGQLIITASTKQEYRDIKNALQEHHRGPKANNNLTYSHRPTDENGKSTNALIEWVPFAQSNGKLELGSLFEQVNKKIDSVYGVPASMRGVNDNNTYASVRVDEAIFIDNCVRPRLLKVWSKFTHELNRITGGIGVAITFDLATPNLADEDKVMAEKNNLDMTLITYMTEKGYSLDSVITAFKLPEDYKLLSVGYSKPEAVTVTDNPNVDQGNEVSTAPVSEAAPKTLKAKQITDQDRARQEAKIEAAVKGQLDRQVSLAIAQLNDRMSKTIKRKAYGDTTAESEELFVEELTKEVSIIVAAYGFFENAMGRQLILQAGLSTANVKPFYMTQAQRNAYKDYLTGVAQYFNDQTAEMVRDITENGIVTHQSQAEIEAQLRDVMSGGKADYRATRIARTEVNRASGEASNISMENIQNDTGYKIVKIWKVRSADPCEFCEAMDGEEVGVSETFMGKGDDFVGASGGIMTNDFVDMDVPEMHPNCTCTMVFEVQDA
jgi:phage portal protein BeeE